MAKTEDTPKQTEIPEKQEKPTQELPPVQEGLELEAEKKSGLNMKILLFGLPIFIVQLIVVYFITANILLSKIKETPANNPDSKEERTEVSETPKGELGKHIFLLDDIIVNPAGTDGKRLLLASIGFDLSKEEEKNILKNKEVLIKDIIISTISSKNLQQLDNTTYKDTLKTEISRKISDLIPEVIINNVYFSKYIIQ